MNSKENFNPSTESGKHIEKAYSYKDSDQYKDVLREADAAIELDLSLAEAHNLRGIALEELGHESEAIEAYKKAIDLNPNFREAKSNLSDLINGTRTPEEEVQKYLEGWNWSAFSLTWIWGLCNNVWISLLIFIPIVNLIIPFVLGASGNQLAWKYGGWKDFEHFRKIQRRWGGIALAYWLLVFICIILSIIGTFTTW